MEAAIQIAATGRLNLLRGPRHARQHSGCADPAPRAGSRGGWHFAIYEFWGVVLAYVYFQIPLMILVVAPAIDGLKLEWREAAESLGANNVTYWRRIGLPVLTPALLGAFFLLFVNAFSAYATAQALSSGGVNIVPILSTPVAVQVECALGDVALGQHWRDRRRGR